MATTTTCRLTPVTITRRTITTALHITGTSRHRTVCRRMECVQWQVWDIRTRHKAACASETTWPRSI
jgi:hypothetical protein